MADTANTITVASGGANGNLKEIFNQVKKVFYNNAPIQEANFAKGIEAELEFPILEGGVTFNGPSAEKSEIKLTDGTVWTSKKTLGDSDISLQIASVSDKISSLFMDKKTTPVTEVTSSLGGDTVVYNGIGYAMGIKTVTGALVMFDQSGETMIILPNVELAGTLNGADGDNPAYFNTTVTPLANNASVNIYIFRKKTA